MRGLQSKITTIPLFYIILAIIDFLFTIFNLSRSFIYGSINFGEICFFLLKHVLYLLPIIVLFFISKKVAETNDLQKRMIIKKYVKLYLIINFAFGFVIFLLNMLFDISIPFFPSFLFYSYTWWFSLFNLIKYHIFNSVFNLILYAFFWGISITFLRSFDKENLIEQKKIEEGSGQISTGYKIGVISVVLICIQTIINVYIAFAMHENGNDTGEHAIGTAFVAIILIGLKFLIDFIILPALPLSIIGIVNGNSKKEIEQNRKNRNLGIKINLVCLVIAILEFLFLW